MAKASPPRKIGGRLRTMQGDVAGEKFSSVAVEVTRDSARASVEAMSKATKNPLHRATRAAHRALGRRILRQPQAPVSRARAIEIVGAHDLDLLLRAEILALTTRGDVVAGSKLIAMYDLLVGVAAG